MDTGYGAERLLIKQIICPCGCIFKIGIQDFKG